MFPEVFKDLPENYTIIDIAGSATIIEVADIPKRPSSPNIPRNTVVGALAGFVLSILIVFLYLIPSVFEVAIKVIALIICVCSYLILKIIITLVNTLFLRR